MAVGGSERGTGRRAARAGSAVVCLAALAAVGCSRASVPDDARLIHTGVGAIRARVKRDSVVWVKDDTTGKIVLRVSARRGDPVVLDSAAGTVTVGDAEKSGLKLDPADRYVVYEKP